MKLIIINKKVTLQKIRKIIRLSEASCETMREKMNEEVITD